MLYKAALKDTCSTNSSVDSSEGDGSAAPTPTNAPHPYLVALGVLSIQKVLDVNDIQSHVIHNYQCLQYLTEECSSCSLSEFKAMLENRHTVREQLTEDLKKKRKSMVAFELIHEYCTTKLASLLCVCRHHLP